MNTFQSIALYTSLLVGLFTLTPYQSLKTMGAPRAAAGVSSVASALGAPIGSGAKILARIYECATDLLAVVSDEGDDDTIKNGMSILKKLLSFWKTPHHQSPSEQKAFEEDELLERDPSLRSSQQKIIMRAVDHVMTAYSPLTNPAKRIEALFSVNQLKILGSTGRFFKNGLALLNRHHFTQEGLLRCYQFPLTVFERGVYVRELILFLKLISPSKEQFCAFLKKGVEKGISALNDYYHRAHSKSWHEAHDSTKTSERAKETLKELADLSSAEAIEQKKIVNNKVNQDFLKIIGFCSSLPKSFEQLPQVEMNFRLAKELLEKHRLTHSSESLCKPYLYIKNYYEDMLTRWHNHKKTLLKAQ